MIRILFEEAILIKAFRLICPKRSYRVYKDFSLGFGKPFRVLQLQGLFRILFLDALRPFEIWSSGPLGLWSLEPLGLWSSEPFGLWYSEPLGLWSLGLLGLWSSEPFGFWCS